MPVNQSDVYVVRTHKGENMLSGSSILASLLDWRIHHEVEHKR
jgi:hypothetical protein